jgi:predicted secreted protein
MRRLPALAMVWFAVLGCAAALAGDHATFAPIGYSADNHYFAFEEFSIGDEATSPFATIGLVDLTTGTAVAGSPWTAGGSEETADAVTALRLQAIGLATDALGKAGISDPGHFLALVGDGVRNAGETLTFGLPQGADPDAIGPDLTLDIVTLPALLDDHCSQYDGGKAIGFVLMLTSEGRSRELHHQDATDSTEACIRRLKLYGVLQPYNGGDVASLVAVLSVYTVGFEGYDRRFMVIPLGNSNP